ncbi:MAG: class I SAM-dependent methyltransferase family protein, partial [Phycisphaerae bacterium]|nr:class I SAM-dependent methyltransferase family protein [Phycisphaerae bacterium]
NWADPGGWRSMVISYDGQPKQIVDRILVGAGAVPMALRNRRLLGGRLLTRLIEKCDHEPVHVLCLGAGPGRIIIDALSQARRDAYATLVDLNPDAFDYGRQLASQAGLSEKVSFHEGDVRDVKDHLSRPVDLVKMLGICEYLGDAQIVDIVGTLAEVMPAGASIVFNSLSKKHGTDRFFRRVFALNMIHRSPPQLQELIRAAGFGDFVSIPEPMGVYHVIVALRKPN